MNHDLVPRGITPLCGWQWIKEHYHNLDGWTPTIEISRPGSKFTITAKQAGVVEKVAKIVFKP